MDPAPHCFSELVDARNANGLSECYSPCASIELPGGGAFPSMNSANPLALLSSDSAGDDI